MLLSPQHPDLSAKILYSQNACVRRCVRVWARARGSLIISYEQVKKKHKNTLMLLSV